MAIDDLLKEHAEIGDLMKRSEQTKWPPDSLALAKAAAIKSHTLAGMLLAVASEFDDRLKKLETVLESI